MADTHLSKSSKRRGLRRRLRELRADFFGWGLVRLDIGGRLIRPTLRASSRDIKLKRLGLTAIRVDAASTTETSRSRKIVRIARLGRLAPLRLGLPKDLFRISVQVGDLEGAATLRLSGFSPEGEPRGSASLPLASPQRHWFIKAPRSETFGELTVMTEGEARFGRLAIQIIPISPECIERLERQAEEAVSVVKTEEIAAPIKRLYRAGHYQEVLALQADAALQVEPVNRLAFASYVSLRRFDDALRFHDRWSPTEDAPSWEGRRLEALANLGNTEVIAQRIAHHLGAPSTADRARLLLAGLPYLDAVPSCQVAALEALAATPLLTPANETAAIDAANRMIFTSGGANKDSFIAHVLAQAPIADGWLLQSNMALKDGAWSSQIERLNKALAVFDLDPVASAAPEKALRASALRCDTCPASAGGPLVSVIMTASNSAPTISYALCSLLNQTHEALEIIVIDDASTDDTADIVEALAARDPRLRLLRRRHNGGTYRSRNTGLAVAQGQLVTNHDSDDWAHPRKIERLLAAMRPNDIAAWGHALRLTPDVGLLCRGGFINMEAASLMFEREAVLDAIGGYDDVRAGGDGEYQRRLERRFGLDNIAPCPAPLSIMAVRSNSLSRSGRYAIDQSSGVFSAERNAYRRRYLERLSDSSALSNPDPRRTNTDDLLA